MKNIFFIVSGLLLVVGACNQSNTTNTKNVALENTTDSISYGLGVLVANDFKSNDFYGELDYNKFMAGVFAIVDSIDIKISTDEAQKLLQNFAQKKSVNEAMTNKKEGEEFLVQNAQKEGVITLPDGLQYIVLKEGEGASPDSTDEVTVNYEGRFINGKVFDSSYSKGEPVSFPLYGVIKGWKEALQLMKPGAKWKLFVPSELAYGAQGYPNSPIKGNMTLIFDIELISVKSK